MERVKVGFVPSHREPFDEEWAVDMLRRSLNALSKVKSLEVIVPDEKISKKGLVRNDEDAEKVIQLFKEEKIEGLIIGTMTFGDEVSALEVASAFRKLPILLFGTKEGPFKADGGRKSDSFCGTLSISSGLYRRKIPFLFAGIIFPEEKAFIKTLENFICVCTIANGFEGAHIGLVGPRPERFETCIFSENEMIKQFNQRVVPIPLADIFNRISGLRDNDPSVREIIRNIKLRLDASEINEETIKKIAKLEYALRKFADEKKLVGMGVQCWTAMEEVYGVFPCLAMGRLTDQGIMMTCEVDIYGTLTMLIQYLSSLKTTPPHFIDWTIQHQKEKNIFLAWHCGNAPPSLACEGCKIALRHHSIMTEVLGSERSEGTAEFQLKSGEVTICRLVEYDGKFKMLITKGEIIKSDQDLRGSWGWVKVSDLNMLYRKLVEEGFIHHASLIHGDRIQAISDACKFLGIETVIV